VPFDPDVVQVRVLLGRATVVLHIAEMTVTVLGVAVNLQEVILWQLQHQCEQDEQLAHDLKVDVLRKIPDLVPMLADHGRMRAFILRHKFGDVVDFRVVLDARLDLSDPQGFVSIVSAILQVGAVFNLLFRGQVKHLLAQAELSINFFLREPEVGNVEETCFETNEMPPAW